MELFALRHGIPVDLDAWGGGDAARPLTEAGESQVELFLSALHARGDLEVDRILSSPLARAQQTAQIAGRVLGAPVETMSELASGASPDRILAALERRQEVPARLMLVGHNPDLPMLVAMLAGGSSFSYILDRCGLARLEGELAVGGMRVAWLRRPGELG